MKHNLIVQAVRNIHNKNCVVFPTETVYGLGANALDREAVLKIFALKNRPQKNPLIVHVAEMQDILKISPHLSALEEKLFCAFSPGPLSIVLKKKENVPYETTGGLNTVAVRIPNHPIALDFLSRVAVPIAAPSANISSKPSPTNFAMAEFYMKGKVEVILDGGNLDIGLESSVIKINGNKIFILRSGYITAEMIADKTGIVPEAYNKNEILSPGMQFPHYKPNANVVLFESHFPPQADRNSAILYYSENLEIMNFSYHFFFQSLENYGHSLYSLFFECDQLGVQTIYCEIPPDKFYGSAICDRLVKAANGTTFS